jgi:hypothetical protein
MLLSGSGVGGAGSYGGLSREILEKVENKLIFWFDDSGWKNDWGKLLVFNINHMRKWNCIDFNIQIFKMRIRKCIGVPCNNREYYEWHYLWIRMMNGVEE